MKAKGSGPICGDDVLPIFICVVAFCGIKTIFTQINFIRNLASDLLLVSEQGYFFSSLESPATFILNYGVAGRGEQEEGEVSMTMAPVGTGMGITEDNIRNNANLDGNKNGTEAFFGATEK